VSRKYKTGGIKLTNFQRGADALNSLNATNEGAGGKKVEFAKFSSGTSYKVRIMGPADLIQFYSFGIFKKVNSFVAKNPAKRNPRGYAVENLGPWDLAFNYYSELRRKASDVGNAEKEKEYSELAYQFKAKERYALGFINLEDGAPIIVDLSKKQAQGVHAVIKKNEKKLGKVAFELEKSGSSTNTIVMLSPLSLDPDDEEVTDKERANFAKHDGKEFDMSLFEGLLYEAEEKEQIENLVAAGFDISLIGLSIGAKADDVVPISGGIGSGPNGDITDDDLPF
jgi:hypothetical protein